MSSASFSIEFFPPKDEAGEARLWSALSELEKARPDFVSVTYGAGGSTRDRTVRITSEVTARTGIPTIAHLTCVGSTQAELISILEQYRNAGIKSILALRGDPQGGPGAPWITTPGGFDHADQLVSLAHERGFEVGVAAFPDVHPASHGDFNKDIEVLLEKERRGAAFATTQFFFDVDRYFVLVEALRRAGSELDVYPGILPITNAAQLRRMAELSGTPLPQSVKERIEAVESDATEVRKVGIDIASEICAELLSRGVPGLHFYTMNSATSTLEIVKRIGLR
ncbi:MAG: methylenetetrahydrofolate reductase [NAD(P)H] [Candidatus Nanopelagicaceae bacterium]|jgi:methylenetetrahydrofolate reductase (NADPH)|nr:methylenetetrahydrofolate reductase [NAD(P)H] [Candidatus Nanopelagicaceae bacterium]